MRIPYLYVIFIFLLLLIIKKKTLEPFKYNDEAEDEYEETCREEEIVLTGSLADESCWCQSPKQFKKVYTTEDSQWNCQQIPRQKTFILFYTDWCSFSKKMLPIWKNIQGRELSSNSDKKFIKINCDKLYDNHKGPEIAKYYGVKQLPTILLIKDRISKPIKYTGAIDTVQFARFVSQH